MKRFSITNSENGLTFVYEGDSLPEERPTEWGKAPVITETDITSEMEASRLKVQRRRAIIQDLRALVNKPEDLTSQETQKAIKGLLFLILNG